MLQHNSSRRLFRGIIVLVSQCWGSHVSTLCPFHAYGLPVSSFLVGLASVLPKVTYSLPPFLTNFQIWLNKVFLTDSKHTKGNFVLQWITSFTVTYPNSDLPKCLNFQKDVFHWFPSTWIKCEGISVTILERMEKSELYLCLMSWTVTAAGLWVWLS